MPRSPKAIIFSSGDALLDPLPPARTLPGREHASSFSKMGLDAALRDFDALMHALDDHAIDHLSFADHAYRKITESEAVILALWTDVAANVHDRASAVLALIVQPEKVVEILERLKRVVGHMADLEFAYGVR